MTKLYTAETLFPAPPNPCCKISIVIPARDEAENLDKTLAAAVAQVDLNGGKLDPRTFEILVLANNCADETAAVARRWSSRENLPPVHVAEIHLPKTEAHVGRARRILMHEAFRRLRVHRRENAGVIASTDADTRVAPDWAAANLFEIERGADAVGGRITIEKDAATLSDNAARRFHLRDAAFNLLLAELEHLLDPQAHDPSPRHHQHFGASLCVRTDVYGQTGGLPPLPHLEDAAFFDALQQMDARFRHSPLVRVTTSARRAGRVAVGLSRQLNEWARLSENDSPQKVASAREMFDWFAARRRLRNLWENRFLKTDCESSESQKLAADLKINPIRLRRLILQSKTFGVPARAVWIEIKENTDWNLRYPLADIKKSTADLRIIVERLRKCGETQTIFSNTSSRYFSARA